MQHACGAAVSARASGFTYPTSVISNRNLEIQRCIQSLKCSKLTKLQMLRARKRLLRALSDVTCSDLSQQHIGAAVGKGDYEVHQDEHQIVMPTGAFLAPEAGVPGGNLFPDRAEHNHDETESSKLREDSESHSEASGEFTGAKNDRESFGHPDAFGTC